MNTEGQTAQDIAIQVFREVRPDLYATHPRAEIERIVSGEALRDLQQEIDRIKEEFSEYQCPYCGALLQTRLDALCVNDQDYWGIRKVFACGYQFFDSFYGSYIERLCPTDPRLPKFDEYELHFDKKSDESHWQWACFAVAKTKMAQLFELSTSHGRTKEEAEN